MSIARTQTKRQLLDEYASALSDYLKSEGEASLMRAYDCGRNCLTIHGMGIVDVLGLHQMVLEEALQAGVPSKDWSTMVERSARFLMEALAPFEMSHRAYREQANQRATELAALNRLFQRHLQERMGTLQKYRGVVQSLGKLAQELSGILDKAQDMDVSLQGQEGINTILGDPGRAKP